ncbi:MAG TPA: FecR domain-containing protein, partial [Puia sp.]|nr:FecR domain-containing protein [Puia sp.]
TAAAVILILLTGSLYRLLNKGKGTRQDKLAGQSERFKNDVLPGSDKATLTLANGRTIVLDSAVNGSLAQQGSARILKLTNGQLVYSPSGQKTAEILYNMIATPRGGQYHIVLTDGTGVWLNAASSIKFPAAFSGKERRVTITGEAYFEVAKNAAMPFIVSTEKDGEVRVLGTQFNVNAYSDEVSMNITLLEGAVQVRQGNAMDLLRPGQMAGLTGDGKIRLVNDADTEEAVAWKNGNFQFQNDGIGTIMRQISRWYDVKVIYEGKIPGGTYSGGVSRNTKMSNVLKILELSDLHFRIEGNTLTVLP